MWEREEASREAEVSGHHCVEEQTEIQDKNESKSVWVSLSQSFFLQQKRAMPEQPLSLLHSTFSSFFTCCIQLLYG
jgi:hypothetical protein